MRYLASIALLGCATLFGAQPEVYTSVTFTSSGTLGPNVGSGSDCFGLNGQSVNVSITLETTEPPVSSTKDTVTYTSGDTSGNIGPLSPSGIWNVTYTLTSKHNKITLSGQGPTGSLIELGALIPPDTISPNVFHQPYPLPARFSPEPLSYPGSSLAYTAPGCSATQLALTGQLAGSTE
jgi:hypothetical protein